MKKKRTDFDKKLSHRKSRMYLVLVLSLLLSLGVVFFAFSISFVDVIYPQTYRAIIQVSRILPQLEQNENSIRDIYDKMSSMEVRLYGTGEFGDEDMGVDTFDFERMINDNLSWMDRISKLKVGHDGYISVISKDDLTILSHPNEKFVGGRMRVPFYDIMNLGADIIIEELDENAAESDLKAPVRVLLPEDITDFYDAYRYCTVARIASYGDTYIICGVGFSELVSYWLKGLTAVFLTIIVMWILVRYICLLLDRHDQPLKALRARLVAYTTIMLVFVFLLNWYLQILSDMTLDLKTMEKHAQVAVDTLEDYRNMREQINDWLDDKYLVQCRYAAKYLESRRDTEHTRAELDQLAKDLGVKYIYIFDKEGKVKVTNSPFDHFVLSEDPDSQSYPFRKLLDGMDNIVQPPAVDDVSDEYLQHIGVSMRDENDLCDGFVQIAIDPALRVELLGPLGVDTVLANLVIGLPEHAVAIDKETHIISATTGIGFAGDPMETIGITEEKLESSFSGFLHMSGKEYYAGFSEASDLFLVPIVLHQSNVSSFFLSLKMLIVPCLSSLLIIVFALWNYTKNVYEAAPKAAEEVASSSLGDSAKDDDTDDRGLFSGFSEIIKVREKYGFEERWKVNIPKEKQSPEMRTRRIVYRLLLILCILVLIPIIYYKILGVSNTDSLDGITYVVTGHWEKSFNIFSFSACILLLCSLYVFIVAADRILYQIARVSDMRVETVCLLIRSALKYICVIIFIYFGLSQFGIPTQTLLASAGLLTLMISIGAKDLVSDIIAGIFIIFEGSIKVGDFITIGSWYGTVQEIGIRTTRVSFFADTKIINNSQIRDVINADGKVARMVFKFQVAYSVDLEKLEEILNKELPVIAGKVPALVGMPRYQGVQSFEENGVLLRIAIYTEPYKRTWALRCFAKEMKLMLDRYGVEIPLPHVVVHNVPYEPPVFHDGAEDVPEDTDIEE